MLKNNGAFAILFIRGFFENCWQSPRSKSDSRGSRQIFDWFDIMRRALMRNTTQTQRQK